MRNIVFILNVSEFASEFQIRFLVFLSNYIDFLLKKKTIYFTDFSLIIFCSVVKC